MKPLLLAMSVVAVLTCGLLVAQDAPDPNRANVAPGAAPAAPAAKTYPQRWNFVGGSTLTRESTDKLIGLLRKSKEVGCTHILWSGARGHRSVDMNDQQRAWAREFHAEADKLGVKIIPKTMSIGYSGKYFNVDSNLAAGVPVREAPFIVQGGKAVADPAVAIDVSKMYKDDGTVEGTAKVKPFQWYRMTWYAEKKPDDRENTIMVTSSGGQRRNTYQNAVFKQQGDKLFYQTVFNTLEGTDIRIRSNAKIGKIADLKIEPAGLLLVLRRPTLPFKVTSDDGQTVYEEGKDFKPVSDPIVMKRPFPGDFFITDADGNYRDAPAIELTADSRIKDGQKLLVSYYHHYRIYNDQDVISMQDPKVWDILETDIRETIKMHPAEGYSLNYDEIRVACWEPWVDGKEMKPGELLAQHFKRAYDLVKKYAPDATVYTWSGMFTPHHNAGDSKKYYYYVTGNWYGAWEGVPKDVVIINWYSPKPEGVKWFVDRGHQQIIAGYYDGTSTEKMKKNLDHWMRVTKDQPGIRGFMYTTWHAEYDHLAEYFKLLDTYEQWGNPSGAIERPKEPGVEN